MVGNVSICKISMIGLISLRLLNFFIGIKLLLTETVYLIEWEILDIIGTSLNIVILVD